MNMQQDLGFARVIPAVILSAVAFAGVGLAREAQAQEKSRDQATDLSDAQRLPGYFDLYWDDATGKLKIAIERFDEPFLYVSSLASGLGSNPVGLDRGQFGDSRVVRFKRVGGRVFLVQMNLKYRAQTSNAAERRAVADSFAESILWAADLETTEDGKRVADLTDFLIRDAHDCVGALASSGQGSYSLSSSLSYVHMERTGSFPKNTEMEATLTFTSDKPGVLANRTAADGKAVTLRQHHSFVELPDDNYRVRSWHPRCGCFSVDFANYSAAIDAPTDVRLLTRHRLIKAVPGEARSRPVEPIVYYLDPGVPQPIRDALIEGASWWKAAFDEAGFVDAFEVKILPEDVDPMDVRYNVIQWVHRATRGWSYGQSIVDPRTGEIIKGHVLLGSLRVRQDRLLFEGLESAPGGDRLGTPAGLSRCQSGMHPSAMALAVQSAESTQLALARIRQLAAHEVGHTLGFAHNFAASTYSGRASVMDYPAPLIKIEGDQLDFSDAYGVGVGQWDHFVTQYAYTPVAAEVEAEKLAEGIDFARDLELLYLSDADARPAGAAHPKANLWDNGSDPAEGLDHAMKVRAIGLRDFGPDALAAGEPTSDLQRYFAPVYLHHRYQVIAAVKMLGGVTYQYSVAGDPLPAQEDVPTADQRRAFESLMATLRPEVLVIEKRILEMLPPKAVDSAADRERFESKSSPIFDPVAVMEVAADLTLAGMLQPQRATRLARIESNDWGLEVMLQAMQDSLVTLRAEEGYRAAARRVALRVFIRRLIELSSSSQTNADVHAIATARLIQLEDLLSQRSETFRGVWAEHSGLLAKQIQRHLDRPDPVVTAIGTPNPPPGSPIGAGR